ncbi:hypothetical protein ACLB9X_34215 [Streptomyces sp. 5K101]|uniref:hypothetical protein n=1 Tax=Streptomyces sp. 5K101 TaxID=3390037 RepID=UPI0039748D31
MIVLTDNRCTDVPQGPAYRPVMDVAGVPHELLRADGLLPRGWDAWKDEELLRVGEFRLNDGGEAVAVVAPCGGG